MSYDPLAHIARTGGPIGYDGADLEADAEREWSAAVDRVEEAAGRPLAEIVERFATGLESHDWWEPGSERVALTDAHRRRLRRMIVELVTECLDTSS